MSGVYLVKSALFLNNDSFSSEPVYVDGKLVPWEPSQVAKP